MRAFYNEIDRYCCDWLSNLMDAGLITPGKIDDRPIQELSPDDLAGFERAHFFAGIGGWDIALNLANWGTRPVWSGSCPCQPFSAAGAGKAADDERHLWPAWFPLIAQRRPAIVFGEQVEAAVGWGWLDAVFADLEGEGYACGAAVLPACGVGAPHIRARTWFVAHTDGRDVSTEGLQRSGEQRQQPQDGGADYLAEPTGAGRAARTQRTAAEDGRTTPQPRRLRDAGELGDASINGSGSYDRQPSTGAGPQEPVGGSGFSLDVAHAAGGGFGKQWDASQPRRSRYVDGGCVLNGFWSDAEWIACTDGKARPVKPRTQRMGDGLPESPSRLRPDWIAEVEKEIVNAAPDEASARKAVHDLWIALWPQAVREWPPGGLNGVHGSGFLLAFLRQLTEQGWAFAESVSRASAETAATGLRGVRVGETAPCPSCGRGLDEQRPRQCADALHLLPSILARHASAAWTETVAQNARDAFPLGHGISKRPSKLRAYGNAIVPQVAAEFITAADEAMTELLINELAEYGNGR